MAIIDVDSHVWEPAEVWELVERAYQPIARSAFWHGEDDAGLETTILNGRPVRPMNRSGINRHACWRPGLDAAAIGALDPEQRHAPTPGASEANARLRDMDAMGVDRALLMPTLFAEHLPLVENPDAARVLAAAYNDWIWDFCGA